MVPNQIPLTPLGGEGGEEEEGGGGGRTRILALFSRKALPGESLVSSMS